MRPANWKSSPCKLEILAVQSVNGTGDSRHARTYWRNPDPPRFEEFPGGGKSWSPASAASHGGQQNASELGAALGWSDPTIQSCLDFPEGAFLIRRLPPYFKNLTKRLVKTPKIYWRDSGLLHSLLGLSAKTPITSQPWIGGGWEGWVI